MSTGTGTRTAGGGVETQPGPPPSADGRGLAGGVAALPVEAPSLHASRGRGGEANLPSAGIAENPGPSPDVGHSWLHVPLIVAADRHRHGAAPTVLAPGSLRDRVGAEVFDGLAAHLAHHLPGEVRYSRGSWHAPVGAYIRAHDQEAIIAHLAGVEAFIDVVERVSLGVLRDGPPGAPCDRAVAEACPAAAVAAGDVNAPPAALEWTHPKVYIPVRMALHDAQALARGATRTDLAAFFRYFPQAVFAAAVDALRAGAGRPDWFRLRDGGLQWEVAASVLATLTDAPPLVAFHAACCGLLGLLPPGAVREWPAAVAPCCCGHQGSQGRHCTSCPRSLSFQPNAPFTGQTRPTNDLVVRAAMAATFGARWPADPRYAVLEGGPAGSQLGHSSPSRSQLPPGDPRRWNNALATGGGGVAADLPLTTQEAVGLPSWERIAETSVPIVEVIPVEALAQVAAIMARAFQHAKNIDEISWRRLAMLPRCLLFVPSQNRNMAAVINRRCNQWSSNQHAELWTAVEREAARRAAAPRQRPVQESFLWADDDPCAFDLPRSALTDLGTLVDADTMPPEVVTRARRLTAKGTFKKASASLSASAVAPHTEANRADLQTKHPAAPPPTLPAGLDLAENAPTALTPSKVLKALRAFTIGSSGGISGLTPGHLLQLCRYPGSDLSAPLTHVVNRMASGSVPMEARPFFFGARLVALRKRDDSLRPIASGETIRRLTGKALMAPLRDAAAAALLPHCQVGVGVRSGGDGMALALRRYVEARVRPRPQLAGPRNSTVEGDDAPRAGDAEEGPRVVMKVDFRNAFNCVDRTAVLAKVAQHFPSLYAHALAAYGQPTWLQFGPHRLASQCGVQQGDVFGPLFFALVLAEAAAAARAGGAPLELEAWFLDDGVLGGTLPAVAAYFERLRAAGVRYGLQLNDGKCEVICADDAVGGARDAFPAIAKFTRPERASRSLACRVGPTRRRPRGPPPRRAWRPARRAAWRCLGTRTSPTRSCASAAASPS